jgi:glycogen synthase
VGGLGDVAGSLPRALRALSNDDIKLDVRLVLPYHPAVRADNLRPAGMFSFARGNDEIQVEAFETSLNGMPVYFIGGEPIRANKLGLFVERWLGCGKIFLLFSAALELCTTYQLAS